jgi:hypothetical protein
MNNRWVPEENGNAQVWASPEVLYAVLGPELSKAFVKTVENSGEKAATELLGIASRLKGLIGQPPTMLFLMGTAVAGLEFALQNRNYDEDAIPGRHDVVLRELGDETYKHFGSAYMEMFERFGFNADTLRYYMQNCASPFKGYRWPPPGVAYRPMQSEAREG